MNTIEVSIIVPAYNAENTIPDTLTSLINQDYPPENYEIIVVDDGSTDNTFNVAKSFEKNYRGILLKVLKKENGGKGSAQNYGVQNSLGRYILTIDADSIAPSNWIKNMVKSLKKCDVVSGIYYAYNPTFITEKMQNALFIANFRYSSMSVVASGTNFGFRREVFYRIGGFNEKTPSTTFDFIERAKKVGFKFCVNRESYVHTRVHKDVIKLVKQLLRWRENPLRLYRSEKKILYLFPFLYNSFMSLLLPTSITLSIAYGNLSILFIGLLFLFILTFFQYSLRLLRLLENSENTWVFYLIVYVLFEAFIMKPLYLPYWAYRFFKPRTMGSFRGR